MKRLLFQKKNPERVAVPQLPSLALCLLMDFLGYASFSVPILGEFLDVIWAPISALIFFMMFGGKRGVLGGIFNFIEEILPGTDFIPTFTLAWFLQYFKQAKNKRTTISLRPL